MASWGQCGLRHARTRACNFVNMVLCPYQSLPQEYVQTLFLHRQIQALLRWMVLDPRDTELWMNNTRVGHLQGPKASEHPKRAVAIFFLSERLLGTFEIQPVKHAQSPRRKNTELLESLPQIHYWPLGKVNSSEV